MRPTVLLLTVLLAAGIACGGDDDEFSVFAAVSLRAALEEVAAGFQAEGGDVDITFNFAASQQLRFQIEQGAPADVFVSADRAQVALLVDGGLVEGEPVSFAGNRLVVAVAEGNPGEVATLADLSMPGLRLVTAGEAVPLGSYAHRALAALAIEYGDDFAERVRANIVSEEENAEAVVGKVELGEADAAFVYATDRARLEEAGATIIEIAGRYQPEVAYLAAAVKGSDRPGLARDFVDFLTSDAAQRIFMEHGFLGVR